MNGATYEKEKSFALSGTRTLDLSHCGFGSDDVDDDDNNDDDDDIDDLDDDGDDDDDDDGDDDYDDDDDDDDDLGDDKDDLDDDGTDQWGPHHCPRVTQRLPILRTAIYYYYYYYCYYHCYYCCYYYYHYYCCCYYYYHYYYCCYYYYRYYYCYYYYYYRGDGILSGNEWSGCVWTTNLLPQLIQKFRQVGDAEKRHRGIDVMGMCVLTMITLA
nr:hypothetical protein BaRGS_020643 [Batillaria attramentaria]